MRFLLATAAAALVATSAGAVTIINGSFESGLAFSAPYVTVKANNTTSITGWTVLSKNVDYIGSYWEPSDGLRSVDLSGNATGGISQVLTGLTVGKAYTITFDGSGNPDSAAGLKSVSVKVGTSAAEVFTYTTGLNTKANMLYASYSYDFTASSASELLSFKGLTTGPYGFVVDNVSFASSLVPEPAAWALFIAGFAMTGLRLRRRSTSVAA